MKIRTPMVAFWTPRNMRPGGSDSNRKGREPNGQSRRSKANRVMGNAKNRHIYTSAHGYKSKDYSKVCERVNKANGFGR